MVAKAGLGLQDFIFRGEVLKLYRQFIRTTRAAPKHAQGKCLTPPARPPLLTLPSPAGELRGEVRREFEAHKGAPDSQAKKFLLSDGRARLKQLAEMLGMQR